MRAEEAVKAEIRKQEEEWKRLKKLGKKRPPRRKIDSSERARVVAPAAYAIVPAPKGAVRASLSSSLKPPSAAVPLPLAPAPVPVAGITADNGATRTPIEAPNIATFRGVGVYCRDNRVDEEAPPKTPAFVRLALQRDELRAKGKGKSQK